MKLLHVISCLLLICCGYVSVHAQVGKPLPAGGVDSIPIALQKQVRMKEAQLAAPLKKLSVPGDSLVLNQINLAGKQQVDSILGIVKSPVKQLQQQVKLFEGSKPISFNQLQVGADYAYIQDTAGLGLGAFHQMQGTLGYSINYNVSLSGMPFNMSIRENNGINMLNYTPFQNFYKFNFDHAQYLEILRNKLLEKLSPEALMNAALSRVNIIRNNYEMELKGEVGRMQDEYAKEYKSTITVPANATNLSNSDLGALRTQLMPASALQKYQKDMVVLQNMMHNKDSRTLSKDSAYLGTLAGVKKYEAMEKIFSKIMIWKKRFEDNPLVKQLRSTSSFSPGAMKAYLSDPKNLGQVLDDQASMSALQKLFVSIKQLDIGQNAVQSGELGMQNVVNTGVNTEFQNKSTTMGVIYGKNNSVNNWQQAGLTSQVTNEYSNLTGFKLGAGSGSPLDQSVTFDIFHMNNSSTTLGQNTGSSYLPVASHQDGAITIHTGYQFSSQHKITLELSKSFGSYQQTVGVDSSGNGKLPAGGSVFNGAGKSNYAGILHYTGQLFKTDLKLYVKKVGLGYNNPGNALLRSGETQIGLGVARKLLKKKLTLKYDGDYRRQVFDPYGNYIYSAFTNKWQAGYKITKSDKVNLTYQRSDYRSDFYGQTPVFGFNSRLQLDGSYHFTLDRKKVMNNLTISRQETSIPLTTGGNYTDNTLLITNTSSIILKKNLLTLTVLSSHSDNQTYYFNTSLFSTETNYSYTLTGWRMTSGLGYYANGGWNKQLGIHQQVSAMLKQKITLDFQIGYKKAIQIIQTALANQLFMNTTMHYTFK